MLDKQTKNTRNVIVLTIVIVVSVGALTLQQGWLATRKEEHSQISFNRDIRPILNENCVACHGGVKKAEGVSFLYREEALGKGRSGRPTVVPGNPGPQNSLPGL